MKVELAPEAVADLTALSSTFTSGVRRPPRLAASEFEGPACELCRTRERVRSWPVRPYRIYYPREGETLVVLRVYHSARRPITR